MRRELRFSLLLVVLQAALFAQPPADADLAAVRLNTVGASIGTSFAAPWLIGTVQGTFASAPYTFVELGLDFGTVHGELGAGPYYTLKSYYSFYSYAHAGLFRPIPAIKSGLYAGAGVGYMFSQYAFSDGTARLGMFAFDVTAGPPPI